MYAKLLIVGACLTNCCSKPQNRTKLQMEFRHIFPVFAGVFTYLVLSYVIRQPQDCGRTYISRHVSTSEGDNEEWSDTVTLTKPSSNDVTLERMRVRAPRLLCLVLTQPANYRTRVGSILRTWGSKCDHLMFVSSTSDDRVPFQNERVTFMGVDLPIEKKKYTWLKIRSALIHINKTYLRNYEWFARFDDDTYVFVENVKEFLASHNPSQPISFGFKFKQHNGYFAGSSIMVSRQGLVDLVNKVIARPLPKECDVYKTTDDVALGCCFRLAGVPMKSALDKRNRDKILPLHVDVYLDPNPYSLPIWYYNWTDRGVFKGDSCCSKEPMSFHYVTATLQMEKIHYMVYKLNSNTDKDKK